MDKYLPKVSKTIKTVTKKNWLRTIEGKASETCFSLDRLSTVGTEGGNYNIKFYI